MNFASFNDELTKIASKMRYAHLAGLGAGAGAMLNMGGRLKSTLGMDYSPEQKGRSLTGDAARSALATVALGAMLNAAAKGRLK